MRRISIVVFVIISMLSFNELKAQDPQFSQFYAAPLYINPAFTGASGYTRLGVNYRNQWPNLQSSFKTFSFYMDHFMYKANSGIGLIVTTDQEGSIGLKSTSIGGSYAYQLKISENLVFRPGVQFSYFMRNYGFQDLVFANQIDPITGAIDPTPNDPSVLFGNEQISFGDISVGGVLYSRTLFLGAAVQHLTEPNQSIYGDQTEIDTDGDGTPDLNVGEAPLQQRLTIHGGIKLKIGEGPLRRDLTYTRAERSITPVFQYKTQGKFSQLDIGAFVHLEPINLGVQYRGVPFKQFENFPNNEAIIFSVGVTTNNFNIGYSFDYTISELGIEAGGAHEFSLSYFLDFNKPVRVPRDRWRIPCPKN